MAKITFSDKVAIVEYPEIPEINKMTDANINEVKNVVNTNADDLGTISNLTTTDKTSAVAAINELNSGKASANEILIQNTEPTAADNKLWIDSGAVSSQASEITNSYSTSTGIGYSANYTNDKLVKIGTTNDENFKVNFTKGKNLLSRGNIINGIYSVSTGSYVYSATSLCTKNKIEIDNTKNYVLSASSSVTSEFMYIMFYDASGTYLGNISTTFQVGQIKLNTYVNYSNAKYINIRFDQPNVSSPMLEEGDTKTTFEEYYADVLVDNNKVYDQNRLDNAFIEQPYNQQDFNNYTIPGSYMINNTSLANIPVSAPGVLMVWVGNYTTPGTKYIAQLYISNQGAHSRFRDTGATQWGAWKQLHN